MTDDARLRALCDAATPGPWHACEDEGISTVAPGADCSSKESFIASIGTTQADAEFIAACDPATIRSLLDAKGERDMLRAEVAVWTERTKIVAGDRSLIEAAEWADARWADAIDERDALRAERDRLKAQLFDAQQAILTEGMDANNLRERLQRVVDGYKPLRAVAEQAREALALEWLDVDPPDIEECRDARGKALAALDKALEVKP